MYEYIYILFSNYWRTMSWVTLLLRPFLFFSSFSQMFLKLVEHVLWNNLFSSKYNVTGLPGFGRCRF